MPSVARVFHLQHHAACYWVFAKEAHEDCVGHSSKLPGEAVIELSVQHYTNKASDVVQSLPEKNHYGKTQVKHDARPSVMIFIHPAISWSPGWAQHLNTYYTIYTSIYNVYVYFQELYIYIYIMCIYIYLFVFVYLTTYI